MSPRRIIQQAHSLCRKAMTWVGHFIRSAGDKHLELMERPSYRAAIKEGLTSIHLLLRLHPITSALLAMTIAAHVAAYHHENSRPMVHDPDPEPTSWPRFEPRDRGFAW